MSNPNHKDCQDSYWDSMDSVYLRGSDKKYVRIPGVYYCPKCKQFVKDDNPGWYNGVQHVLEDPTKKKKKAGKKKKKK